jgi:nicotinamidase-related amidase
MAKTALLIMDLQHGILGHLPNVEAHLPHYASTIAAARSASIQVIYVTIKFRPNHPDISPRNKMTARIGTHGGFVEGDDSVAIHPAVAPADNDILVTKRRVSAFSGSDLELVLRSLGVENLVLAGILTSGVVLSTVRQASDLDYAVTVLKDLCFDSDPEVHRVLTEKVFPRQADVTTADEWLAGLKAV